MRTVDPVIWSRNLRKPPIDVSRPFKFGLKGLSPFESRLRNSFRDAIREFYKNCSVEGVSYVADRNNPYILRWSYLLAVLITSVGGTSLLVYNISYYGTSPHLSAWEQRGTYAATRDDFPAVAICSFNLISRFSLEKYAQYVYSLDRNNTYSLEQIKQNLLAFGAVHSRRPEPFDFNFESYLKKVTHETNLTNILYKLTPDCSSMLERCSWEARRVNCGRLFAKRITSNGFCCVFNSRYHVIDRRNPVYASRLVGEDSGLAVVVREQPHDITKLLRPLDGFNIYIFDGWQYPAAKAGVAITVPAPHNSMVYVRLKPRERKAGRSLWRHGDDWLGCRLNRNKESQNTPSVKDTWSWCVGKCRLRAAKALCKCTPHTLPPFKSDATIICSLQHLSCLAKYSEKLTWLYPGDDSHVSLREEMENSVDCEDCMADCARAAYRTHTTVIPLYNTHNMFYNHLLKGLNLTNATVVRLFYTAEDRQFFVLEINLPLYGVIALLGSQLVLLVGLTVVSVLELLYHCVFRWCFHYVRRLRLERLVH